MTPQCELHVKTGHQMKQALFLSIIFLVTITMPASAETYVWPQNGHTYVRVGPASWSTCEDAAVGMGGHLVTVNDAAENGMLVSEFTSVPEFWIGFNDFTTEGTWVWRSGETPSYTNWNSGEPNDSGGVEDAAVLMRWQSGKWNDWVNSGNPIYDRYGVVEINTTPVPTATPTTTPTATNTPTATATATPTATAATVVYPLGTGAGTSWTVQQTRP